MTDLPPSAGLIERLQFLASPGALLGGVAFIFSSIKFGPTILDWLSGKEAEREKRLKAEDEERDRDIARLDARTEASMIDKDQTIAAQRVELAEAKKEALAYRIEVAQERTRTRNAEARADFERRSGTRWYDIAWAWYETARALNSQLAQSGKLMTFEAITDQAKPAAPVPEPIPKADLSAD